MICPITITSTDPELFKVYREKFIFLGSTLIAFQMDSDIVDVMKNELNEKVNGVNVIHLCPEIGMKEYYNSLCELIDYIIFEQQNNIVNNHFFIINKYEQYHELALDAVSKHQRKITKTQQLFPPMEDKGDISCFFTQSWEDFTFTFTEHKHQSHFGEITTTIELEHVPLPISVHPFLTEPYKSDDKYYDLVGPPTQSDKVGLMDASGNAIEAVPRTEPLTETTRDPYTAPEPRVAADGELPVDRTSQYLKYSPGATDEQGNIIQFEEQWVVETNTLNLEGHYSMLMNGLTSTVRNKHNTVTIERKARPDEYLVIRP